MAYHCCPVNSLTLWESVVVLVLVIPAYAGMTSVVLIQERFFTNIHVSQDRCPCKVTAESRFNRNGQ